MHHIIVDLEMNAIGKKNPAYHLCKGEIIEIGAVALSDDMQEVSSYKTYVKPEWTASIERRIVDLTGISDEMVRDAPVLADAIISFGKWCDSFDDDITLYSWSNTDYRQLSHELEHKGIEHGEIRSEVTDTPWLDIQKMFDNRMGRKAQSSLHLALYTTGIELEGDLHDALDDARNEARVLQMLSDETLLKRGMELYEEFINPKPLTTSMGSLFDFSQLLSY